MSGHTKPLTATCENHGRCNHAEQVISELTLIVVHTIRFHDRVDLLIEEVTTIFPHFVPGTEQQVSGAEQQARQPQGEKVAEQILLGYHTVSRRQYIPHLR